MRNYYIQAIEETAQEASDGLHVFLCDCVNMDVNMMLYICHMLVNISIMLLLNKVTIIIIILSKSEHR